MWFVSVKATWSSEGLSPQDFLEEAELQLGPRGPRRNDQQTQQQVTAWRWDRPPQ